MKKVGANRGGHKNAMLCRMCAAPNACQNCGGNEPVHGFDRKHIQAAQPVFYVNNGCDGDGNQFFFWHFMAMDAENHVQMLVFIADEGFIKVVFKNRENTYAITSFIGCCHFVSSQFR